MTEPGSPDYAKQKFYDAVYALERERLRNDAAAKWLAKHDRKKSGERRERSRRPSTQDRTRTTEKARKLISGLL